MSVLISDVASELAIYPQICPYDARFYRFLNSAQRQIFLEGNYIGIMGRYNFNVYTGILTCPFDVEAILAADLWNQPVNVQNQWFEFLQSGPGLQDPNPNGAFNPVNYYGGTYPDLYDRGQEHCTVQDPPGPFTVQVFCAVPENPNNVVTIGGWDRNGNLIRSSANIPVGDGTVQRQWINGVQIPLYAAGVPFQTSTQQFNKIKAIQFPDPSLNLPCPVNCMPTSHNGDVYLYASLVDAGPWGPAGTLFLLGIYPYNVTNPTLRRYWFPAAVTMSGSLNGTPSLYLPVPANALVRRRPVILSSPSDRLPIENVEALKNYFQAAWKDEEEQYQSAETLRARGRFCLEQEMRKTKSSVDRLNVQVRGFLGFQRTPGGL